MIKQLIKLFFVVVSGIYFIASGNFLSLIVFIISTFAFIVATNWWIE